jgi:hypothetical protein
VPWNILLLPLLGGFYFCTRCHHKQFEFRKFDGHRLLFNSCLYGLLSLTASVLVTFLFGLALRLSPQEVVDLWQWFDSAWRSFVALPHLRKALLAFGLAFFYTKWKNSSLDEEAERLRVLENEGDRLELLLARAFAESKPLLVTLANGKVYLAGLLLDFAPVFDRKHLAILPYRSGYRQKETLELVFVTDYVRLYQDLSSKSAAVIDDYELILRAQDIVSATIFDLESYERRLKLASAAGQQHLPDTKPATSDTKNRQRGKAPRSLKPKPTES